MRSVRQRPYLTGSAYAAYGYLQAAASGAKRYGDPEMTRFIQRFQLRALLHGKRASAEQAFQERLAAKREARGPSLPERAQPVHERH